MRVLVCGSRDFKDKELMEDVLKGYDIREIIHGDARGADRLAGQYAEENKIPLQVYPADWSTYGRSAGYIRNAQMLVEGNPDFVIAFRGPNSRGTQNMIDQSLKSGIEVRIIEI